MGIDENFGLAYAKAEESSHNKMPLSGEILISVKDKDKPSTCAIVRKFHEMGFEVIATRGTAEHLRNRGIDVKVVNKVMEGRPHIVDLIKNKEISFVINTVSGTQAQKDSFSIRQSALQYHVPYTTTLSGANAAVLAIEMLLKRKVSIRSLREYHSKL